MNISARQQMCPAEQHAFGHAVTVPAELAEEPQSSFTTFVARVNDLPVVELRAAVRRAETARDNWRISRPTTPVATQSEAAAITGNAVIGRVAKFRQVDRRADPPAEMWHTPHRMPGAQREAVRQQKLDPDRMPWTRGDLLALAITLVSFAAIGVILAIRG